MLLLLIYTNALPPWSLWMKHQPNHIYYDFLRPFFLSYTITVSWFTYINNPDRKVNRMNYYFAVNRVAKWRHIREGDEFMLVVYLHGRVLLCKSVFNSDHSMFIFIVLCGWNSSSRWYVRLTQGCGRNNRRWCPMDIAWEANEE